MPSDTYTIAERNLRAFLMKASFATNVDRHAALNCVDALCGYRKWVSVEDRMPPKNTEVLIAFRDCSLPSTGQYTASEHDTWGWCFPSENDPEETGPITHWMPLPEHPAA